MRVLRATNPVLVYLYYVMVYYLRKPITFLFTFTLIILDANKSVVGGGIQAPTFHNVFRYKVLSKSNYKNNGDDGGKKFLSVQNFEYHIIQYSILQQSK